MSSMTMPVLLRDLFQGKRAPTFQSMLNLLAIEDGVLIGTDLQMTQVYRLKCPDTLFFSDAEAAQHAVALGRLLDGLPPNCAAQLIVRVRWNDQTALDDYEAVERPKGEMLRFIMRDRIGFLRKKAFKTVEHYLAVTTHPSGTDLAALRMRSWKLKLPDVGAAAGEQHQRRIQELKTLCAATLGSLRDAKVVAEPLAEDELRAFLYERLNPGSVDVAPPKHRSGALLRGEVALNAVINEKEFTKVDGFYHRAINLEMRPTALDGRAMHTLIDQIPGDFDLVVAIHTLFQEAAEKRLKTNATIAFTLGQVHITRYHEAELQTKDADDLVADSKATFQKLYVGTVHVVLRDADLKRLTSQHQAALEAFRRLEDATAIVDDMSHLELFLASLPGHAHLNHRPHDMNTEIAARFLTMSASWNGCPNPQILLPADDGKLLGIDLFSPDELTAKHSLILGVSGEGKSFLTNALLTFFAAAESDNHVVIIDDGGSYRRLCDSIPGAQYLEPTLDGKYSFNPFLAEEHAFDEKGQLDADFLSFITLLIQLMMRLPDLSNNEKSIIQRCVEKTYQTAKTDPPLLGDLRAVFGNFQGDQEDTHLARRFFKNLELWTEGTYGRLLNRPSTFDASSRFIVFDLNKMAQEDLKPVLLLIIKSVIHPKLANKKLRKLIALDEVWKFLRDKAGADLVTEWYKTGRRFNTGVSVITQSADDLLTSSAASAIAENSTVKWVLNIGGGYDKLAALKLSPVDVEFIRSLGKNPERAKYRKVFLSFGGKRAVVRNMVSPAAYYLYTTDPSDLRCEGELRGREADMTLIETMRTLGALREANENWRADDILRAIKKGRYSIC